MTGPASPRSLPAIPLPAGAAAGAPRVSPLAPAAAVSHRRSAQSWLADFLAAPPQTDDCVRWPYGTNSHGYGQVRWAGRMQAVTRVVLAALVGPPPNDSRSQAAHAPVVCHTPACVNPRHLRWATPAENHHDQRPDGTLPRGSRNGQSKLTEREVLAIHQSPEPPYILATQYGVSRETISQIKNGRVWRWLTSPTAIDGPSTVAGGPAAPTPPAPAVTWPGALCAVSAARGRPSTAGPGPRGGGPGQLMTEQQRLEIVLDMLRQWAAAEDDPHPGEELASFYGRRLGHVEGLVRGLLDLIDADEVTP